MREEPLPNPHPFPRRQILFLPRLHPECGIPRIQVAHFQRAVLSRLVAVGQHLLAQRGIARLFGPALREGYEELLIAVKPFCGWRRLTCE